MSDQSAQYWSAKKAYAPSWYSFCAEEINRRVSGDPSVPPTIWGLLKFAAPLPTAHLLEIGCLDGEKLGRMFNGGLMLRASGVDVAADAIARGKEKWGDRLELKVGDLNKPELPENTYSCVLANGVLHHIENLEECVEALYRSLVPGGVLLASEFTGPCRYDYSDKEIQAIRDGQVLLPPILKGKAFDPADLARKLAADPSEAIRTRDIGRVLASVFDDVIERPYGGNVLMRGLTPSFFKHLNLDDPEHLAGIKRIINFDRRISKSMPSHHTFFAARKAPGEGWWRKLKWKVAGRLRGIDR